MYSLYENLACRAHATPEHACLIEAETGRSLSYHECLLAVRNICRHTLCDEHKNIILQIPNGITNALIWLSALAGGHTLIPLAPDASPGEKQRAIKMFPPDIIFVPDRVNAEPCAGPSWEDLVPAATIIDRETCELWLAQASQCWLPLAQSGQPGRVCIMTSGSTGEPKGVVLEERQILWTARQICEVHQLGWQDRGLTTLPFFHVNAPVVSLCASILAGATVVIANRFSRSQFWEWIERYEITWASLVPAIVAILLQAQDERPTHGHRALRFVRTGSAPLPASHLRDFEARFGVPIIETYGLSEAASMIVANPLPPQAHKPGSTGRPIGVSLRICERRQSTADDEMLQDVAPGAIGEVCVCGPNLIHAYYGNSGLAAFQNGWFRTGDLGYLDDDGYLFLVGRLRAVINRGGENIAPREIEETLQDHRAVREAAAVGRPDAIYGELVVAYLALHEDYTWTPELELMVREYAKQHLSAHKVPVEFLVLDELPKNRVGKLDRETLKAREEDMARVSYHSAR